MSGWCVCGSDRVEAFHVDKDAAEEPLEDLGEDVAHQPDEAQLQVLGHFLQDAAGVLLHLVHRQARLQSHLRRDGGDAGGRLHGGGRRQHLLTSDLSGHVAQVLRLQHRLVELGGRAAGGVFVRVRAERPQGEAEVGAPPSLLQDVQQLLLGLQVTALTREMLEGETVGQTGSSREGNTVILL